MFKLIFLYQTLSYLRKMSVESDIIYCIWRFLNFHFPTDCWKREFAICNDLRCCYPLDHPWSWSSNWHYQRWHRQITILGKRTTILLLTLWKYCIMGTKRMALFTETEVYIPWHDSTFHATTLGDVVIWERSDKWLSSSNKYIPYNIYILQVIFNKPYAC